MIDFAPCKINIGLRILDKREDGFHNIESYLYPLPLYDVLEIKEHANDEIIQTGIIATPIATDNLVFQTIQLLRKSYQFPFVKIHLHKQIPVGAGLGGGSSNAVSALKLINAFFKLNIHQKELFKLALKLGSDCPFFLNAKPAIITGRGDIITPCDFSLAGKYILLVKPNFAIQTAKAFEKIDTKPSKINHLKIPKNIERWQKELINDFELELEKEHQEIREIKNKLFELGAQFVSLSGSGSTVYGIFNSTVKTAFNSSYFTCFTKLQ